MQALAFQAVLVDPDVAVEASMEGAESSLAVYVGLQSEALCKRGQGGRACTVQRTVAWA